VIFQMAIVNSYLIYKDNYVASVVIILQFRESLARSLLLCMPFEKLRNLIRGKNQQAILSANLLITSSKKRKNLTAMSEDAVLAATTKSDNNSQERQVIRQQRK